MQEERAAERRAIAARILQQKIDAMQEKLPWDSLQPILLPPDCADGAKRGEDSQEVNTQIEREKVALGAFFKADAIPDSPSEPPDAADRREGAAGDADDASVPVIPIDDSGSGSGLGSSSDSTQQPVATSAPAPAAPQTWAAPPQATQASDQSNTFLATCSYRVSTTCHAANVH
eukprot:COSAG02_NODE_7545_length_2968_cov_1.526316_3_plen_174_part_00